MKRTIRTICPIGNIHMLDVTVEDDRIVDVSTADVEGNRGHNVKTCVKATRVLPWSYRDDEKRVIYPMMRKGKGGPWERVSWDDALDTIVVKLKELKQNYGPEALAIEFGSAYILGGCVAMHALGQFSAAFGTPNIGGYSENCYVPRVVCNFITVGGFLTPDLDPRANPGSIFVWGTNPSASAPPLSAKILDFKREKGSKLVVVDPRRTPLAKAADVHLQIRPGTDTALALAMINTIIEEEMYDAEFVEKYTSGFDKLTEHAKRYKPEFVADIVGAPASLIREAAGIFDKSKPTALLRFLGGFETASNSFEAHRAGDILCAITGNIDKEGSNIIPEPHTGYLMTSSHKWLGPAIGSDYHPVFPRLAHNAVGACYADAILNSDPYPLRAIIFAGTNASLMHVNSQRIREAYRKLDFVVQIDIRFNDTTELADVFLPTPALLEKLELGTGYSAWDNDMLGVQERVFSPPGECLPDYEIWWRLSKRLGFEVPESFEDACNSMVLKPIGLTLEDLRKEPYYYRKEFEKYKKKGFSTPSGKVEIYSTYLEKRGFHPLPTYVEAPESSISVPSLALKYPLIAIDFRSAHYFHTRFRECAEMRKFSPEPEVEINPRDAEKYGIANGDLVVMESLRGGIEVKAKVTEDIKEGVVGVETGWSDPANYNFLTGDDVHQRDPVTGGAMFRAFLCRVRKAGN